VAVRVDDGLALAAAEDHGRGLGRQAAGSADHVVLHLLRRHVEGLGQLVGVDGQDRPSRQVRHAVPVSAEVGRGERVQHHRAGQPGHDSPEQVDRAVHVGEARAEQHRVGAVSQLQDLLGCVEAEVARRIGRQRDDEGLRHGHREGGGDGLGCGDLELACACAQDRLP
jgi:hypothetical protein